MSKTLLYLLLLIALMVFIALVFSLFLAPKQTVRYSSCILLQNPQTKTVDCFGCVRDKCKDAPVDWTVYEKPTDTVGIPYACFEGETGCQLAQ